MLWCGVLWHGVNKHAYIMHCLFSTYLSMSNKHAMLAWYSWDLHNWLNFTTAQQYAFQRTFEA